MTDDLRFALLDQVPIGVCALDRELRVLFWNTCLAGWTGVAAASVVGRRIDERYPHLGEKRYRLRLQGVLDGGPPTVFSPQLHPHLIPAPMPGGRLRIQHTMVTAVARPDGEGHDVLLSIQDLTELTHRLEEQRHAEQDRRTMEARIQHAQKLESLGVLAGGIAHDFNNLLVGILGNADLALRHLGSGDPARSNMEAVIKSAQRAADLSNQMLAYSGKGKFVTLALDLSEWVEDALELLRVAISKKAVLDCRLARDLPAIEADPTQIRQVLMNLVTNASDALEGKRGKIKVTTGVEECGTVDLDASYPGTAAVEDGLDPGTYVFLEVEDTGHGMDEATIDKIFDPFFTTKFAGRGLGLAAVLGIVRGHRGTLTIDSKPGWGTTFRVLFPASDKAPERSPTLPAEPQAFSAEGTVLVVDDEEMVRTFARHVLEQVGLSVLEAADGEECLRVFRENAEHVGVVLLDMTMPALSGEETFQELRRIRPDVKVVLSSGYTQQSAAEIDELALAGFIQKPYLPQDLVAKLHEVLSARSDDL